MLQITWEDIENLRRFDNALKSLGDKEMRKVANRAINRAGDQAKTKVIRALTKQTGLKRKTIVRALTVKRSSWGSLTYTMTTRGGDISLKYFGARETRKGVSAAPFGKRQIFRHTFTKGGNFPKRKALGMGGHVFMPDTSVPDWGRSFDKQQSGVIIPAEMVKGATRQMFEEAALPVLAKRLEHEIRRATDGVVS